MAIADSKTIVKAVVPKTVAGVIDRLAKASGKTRSTIIAEFLIEAEPAIKRIAGMMEFAKQQQGLFPKSTVAELEAAIDQLSGNAVEVMDRVHNALQLPLEGVPAKGKGKGKGSPMKRRTARSAATRKSAKNPRLVTRG